MLRSISSTIPEFAAELIGSSEALLTADVVWTFRARVSELERERDAEKRGVDLLESKLSSMEHEREVLAKLRSKAEGSTIETVSQTSITFPVG